MTGLGKPDFKGTERFSIRQRLGSGGFGVVYKAYDLERNSIVALKTLQNADPEDLYRFKQEFRALADVTHPNLAALYELISDQDQWFFTMELIEGGNFLDYVCGDEGEVVKKTTADDTTRRRTPPIIVQATESAEQSEIQFEQDSNNTRNLKAGNESEVGDALSSPRKRPDMDRLRRCLKQLAEGINALHKAGKLHCDIKPSNILVTKDERVVLLDFGLVTELKRYGFERKTGIGGTPAYMSPEQAAGLPVTEASDWYSVGVMLYEALTGRPHFLSRSPKTLELKQKFNASAPKLPEPDAPEDLDALCRKLLCRSPDERPSGAEVLRLLGASEVAETISLSASALDMPLVGREAHLAQLQDAFRVSRTGRAVAVCIEGPSGMGKSSLARSFLEDLRRCEKNAIVLEGRCYEQESVPYKALDSLIDELSQYLSSIPLVDAIKLMPREISALARLFPVLQQVKAFAAGQRRIGQIPDSLEMRLRAFAALREMFERLTDKRPVVLFIDDLQWGDLDSAALLGELLGASEPPPLLFIAAYRAEDVETSPFLRFFLQSLEKGGAESRRLTVGELSPEDGQRLAFLMLGEKNASLRSRAQTIALEAGGSPFFISELARHSEEGGEASRSGAQSRSALDQMIEARVMRLPVGARCMLEAIAVAGSPVGRAIAKQAAETSSELNADEREEIDEHKTIAILRAGRFVRAVGAKDADRIEAYHDRIRETVVANLSPDALRERHQHLAWILEASGEADDERLMIHFQGAGDAEKAAKYAVSAADQAAGALAFDHAARLYALALELRHEAIGGRQTEEDPTLSLFAFSRLSLQVKLADALANAGRGAEAAERYLEAARERTDQGNEEPSSIELERRAAEQLLRSGRIDKGLSTLRSLLAKVGMKWPETQQRALASLLAHRMKLRLRGLKFEPQDESLIPAEDLIRMDICWSAALGLGLVDSLRGSDFQSRHLLLALKSGEIYRIARGLAVEIAYVSTPGSRTLPRIEKLVCMANELAEQINHPYTLAMVASTSGFAAFNCGDWKKAYELTKQAEKLLREHCSGAAWELNNVQYLSLRSMFYLGELKALSQRLPGLLKEAEYRGDLYAQINLRTRNGYFAHLMDDSPDLAREELIEVMSRWSQKGFHVQHYSDMVARVEIELYAGRADDAWTYVKERWKALSRSLLLRVQVVRIYALHLRARSALAMGKASGDESLLTAAQRDARSIEREKTAWGDGLAKLIRAEMAAARGKVQEAIKGFASAEKALQEADMALHAAAACRRRGELIGGDEGRAIVERIDAWMTEQRIKNPSRMTAMLAP